MTIPGAGLIQRERARVRSFFGLDLPESKIKLRFDLPPSERGGNAFSSVTYWPTASALTRSANPCQRC